MTNLPYTPVETARVELAASTLARRDRSRTVVPIARRHESRRDFHGIPLFNCQGAGTFTLRGGAPQGPDESNAHSARVGAEPPNRWLIPMKLETARQGLSWGRRPSWLSRLSGRLPARQFRPLARRHGEVPAPLGDVM